MSCGSSYSSLAPASTRALRREQKAKDAFVEAKEYFGVNGKAQLQRGDNHSIVLLAPGIHQTSIASAKWVTTDGVCFLQYMKRSLCNACNDAITHGAKGAACFS